MTVALPRVHTHYVQLVKSCMRPQALERIASFIVTISFDLDGDRITESDIGESSVPISAC